MFGLIAMALISASTSVDVNCSCVDGAMECKSTDGKDSLICHQGGHSDCATTKNYQMKLDLYHSKETLVAAASITKKPSASSSSTNKTPSPAPEVTATKATCSFEGGGGGNDPYLCRDSSGKQICLDDIQV